MKSLTLKLKCLDVFPGKGKIILRNNSKKSGDFYHDYNF